MTTAIAQANQQEEPLEHASIRELQSVTKIDDLLRFQVKVQIHPVHQYEIAGKREKYSELQPDGRSIQKWRTPKSVMVTADGYDYLNRIMGVQLVQPEQVPDESGTMVNNPIHRPDYLFLRLLGIWRNDLGQLTAYREDVEVDFKKIYADTRLNAVWYDKGEDGKRHTAAEVFELARDGAGQPVLDEVGNPVYRLDLPADAELKALQTLSQLRRFGIRYCFTVAKTRILKTASGIRRLPISEKRPVSVAIAGWRDLLRPEDRLAQAQRVSAAVWGTEIQHTALTDDELEVVGQDEPEFEEHIEAEAVPSDDEELPDIPGGIQDKLDLDGEADPDADK